MKNMKRNLLSILPGPPTAALYIDADVIPVGCVRGFLDAIAAGPEGAPELAFFRDNYCLGCNVYNGGFVYQRDTPRTRQVGSLRRPAPSRGSTGQTNVPTRPARLTHLWGATSCCKAAPLSYVDVLCTRCHSAWRTGSWSHQRTTSRATSRTKTRWTRCSSPTSATSSAACPRQPSPT